MAQFAVSQKVAYSYQVTSTSERLSPLTVVASVSSEDRGSYNWYQVRDTRGYTFSLQQYELVDMSHARYMRKENTRMARNARRREQYAKQQAKKNGRLAVSCITENGRTTYKDMIHLDANKPSELSQQDGWISPQGKFYACPTSSQHYTIARKFCPDVYSPIDYLERSGWLHISWAWTIGDSSIMPFKPNQTQLDVLFDMQMLNPYSARGREIGAFLGNDASDLNSSPREEYNSTGFSWDD